MSFTSSFTAYQRVGVSRRATEHSDEHRRRGVDDPGEAAPTVRDGAAADGGPVGD